MLKLTKRKGFVFYRSYYDVYNELESTKDKVAFIEALLDRQFLGKKPEKLTGLVRFAYISQTDAIDKQVKGFEDKTGITLSTPPTEGEATRVSTPPTLQEKDKEKDKEKDIKKPLSFVPPSVDEIAEYAKEKGYVADANKIFHYYNDNDWKDSKGNQVKNWKSKILNNWFNERLPDPNEGIFYHNGHAYRPPDPTKPYKCRARGSESYVSKKDYYMYKEEGELCGFKSIRVPDNDAQIKE